MRAEILYYCMIKKICSRQSEKVVFYAHFDFIKYGEPDIGLANQIEPTNKLCDKKNVY